MVHLRCPSSLPSESGTPIAAPSLSWISGSWNVTHSTLPMWRKNRNVRITYTPVAGTSPAQLNDVVSYQPLSSKSLKTVHGVDKPFDVAGAQPAQLHGAGAGPGPDADADADADADRAASLGYNWRGKGWLVIASSRWEILGYGEEEGTGNQWVVTYFAKTLFTPAGVDLYSRNGSLALETVETLKAGLAGLGGHVAGLATQVFEVRMDGDRED